MTTQITAKQLFDLFVKAEERVTAKRQTLNSLNVYPVPDGDTGNNMSLTLKEVLKSIEALNGNYNLDSLTLTIAESSLMGARGNSGVILSQFIGGFCEVLKGKDSITKELLTSAFEKGTQEAYNSVTNPVEGTILTVMKSAAEAMKKSQDKEDIKKILSDGIHQAQNTLQKTPEMLQTLKDAGVVDAGGAGFVYFLEGLYKGLIQNGEDPITATDDFSAPPLARVWTENFGVLGTGGLRAILDFNIKAIKFTVRNLLWIARKLWVIVWQGKSIGAIKRAYKQGGKLVDQLKSQNIEESNVAMRRMIQVWRESPEENFCTEGILTGVKQTPQELEKILSKMGTSLIIAQKGKYTKIHFHVKDKDEAKKLFESLGTIEKFKADDLQKQHHDFIHSKLEADIEENGTEVIGVVNGNGFKKLYEGFEGVSTIDGGDTMNPSVSDFENAINKAPSPNIILLPNNKNVFLAAQNAQKRSKKQVAVIETTDQAQGLITLLNFNQSSKLSQNEDVMKNALRLVKTFSITIAVKESTVDGKTVKKGEIIATTNKEIIANGDKLIVVLQKALDKYKGTFQLLTLYWGTSITKEEAEAIKKELQETGTFEIQLYDGNQPHYHFIIALE